MVAVVKIKSFAPYCPANAAAPPTAPLRSPASTSRQAGIPEAIEAAVYDGLTKADQAEIEQRAPKVFPNPETAIAWGFDQGAFEALPHARNAYDKVRREGQPTNAQEMAALWVSDVRARLLELNGNGK